MTQYTNDEMDRLLVAMYGLPLWEDDPIAQHFGWVEGVPICGPESPCRHGWDAPPQPERLEDHMAHGIFHHEGTCSICDERRAGGGHDG